LAFGIADQSSAVLFLSCRGTLQDSWIGWNEWRNRTALWKWMHLLVLEKSMTKGSILSETCHLWDSPPAERSFVFILRGYCF